MPHWSTRPSTPPTADHASHTRTPQGYIISSPSPNPTSLSSETRHLPISCSDSTNSQGSEVVDRGDISSLFKKAALHKGLRQQGRGNQTPDYLQTGGNSHRRSEALASSPPVSPMDGESEGGSLFLEFDDNAGGSEQCPPKARRQSRFLEHFDDARREAEGRGAEHLGRYGAEDRAGGRYHAQFSNVNLYGDTDEQDVAGHVDRDPSTTFSPPTPTPISPPALHAGPDRGVQYRHPHFYVPHAPPSSSFHRPRLQRYLSKVRGHKRRTAKYIFLSLLLFVVVGSLVYAVCKFLPLYNKLQDLKDKLAAVDEFKDKVTAKLGAWLDDGKDLASNVKDKAKDTADKVVDAANKVLGKVKVSIPHVEFDRRDAASAVDITVPFPVPPAAEWDARDAESVGPFTLEEKKGSKSYSILKPKPKPKPAHHCGAGKNCTSAARGRGAYMPLPLGLFTDLLSLAHGKPFASAPVPRLVEGCATSTVTLTATIWTPVMPTSEVRDASFATALERMGVRGQTND